MLFASKKTMMNYAFYIAFFPLCLFWGNSSLADSTEQQAESPPNAEQKPLSQQKWWQDYRQHHVIQPQKTVKSTPSSHKHRPKNSHPAPSPELHKMILKGSWVFAYEQSPTDGQYALTPPKAGILRFKDKNNPKNSLNFILNPLSDDVLSPGGEKLIPPALREDAVISISTKYFNCKNSPIILCFSKGKKYALKNIWCENNIVIGTLKEPRHLDEIPAYNQQRQQIANLISKNVPIALSQGKQKLLIQADHLEEVRKFQQASTFAKNKLFFQNWQDYWLNIHSHLEQKNQEILAKANNILQKSAHNPEKTQTAPTSSPSKPQNEMENTAIKEQADKLAAALKIFLKNPNIAVSQKTL